MFEFGGHCVMLLTTSVLAAQPSDGAMGDAGMYYLRNSISPHLILIVVHIDQQGHDVTPCRFNPPPGLHTHKVAILGTCPIAARSSPRWPETLGKLFTVSPLYFVTPSYHLVHRVLRVF